MYSANQVPMKRAIGAVITSSQKAGFALSMTVDALISASMQSVLRCENAANQSGTA